MKKLSSLMAIAAMLILPSFNVNAAPPFAVTGSNTTFWLDVKVVNDMAANGASCIKIFAGKTNEGESCYLMVGGDATGRTMSGNVFMQNHKGVCPPACDFTSVDLSDANNSYIDAGQASGYINTYKNGNADANNCAVFTLSSLATMRSSSTYIKVVLTTSATATGLKEDGTSVRGNVTGTASTSDL